MSIKISNSSEAKYSAFDTTYEISIADTSKYDFENGGTIVKEIHGNGEQEETVSFKLKIKDLTNRAKEVKIRITATEPYSKTVELTIKVTQEGAIQSIEDLVDLSKNVKKSGSDAISQRFKMTRDLDFKNKSSYDNADRTDYGDANGDSTTKGSLYKEMTEGSGFMPIGSKDKKFAGCFNGGNYTLSNLLIDNKVKEISIGLFGYIDKATVKNIEVDGVVKSTVMCAIAGITGSAYDSTIDNCVNKANVSLNIGRWQAAGVVAGAYGSVIKHCENYGEIREGNHTGGVVGIIGTGTLRKETDILYCKNYGKVVNTLGTTAVGGIVAHQASATSDIAIIDSCENYGEISVDGNTNESGEYYEQKVGGIFGVVRNKTIIRNCINCGTLIGHLTRSDFLFNGGGILGRIDNSVAFIDNCCNKGTLQGEYRMGGILGHVRDHSKVYISNCYNEGYLEDKLQGDGSSGTGGIIGCCGEGITVNMINCYNKSSMITGYKKVGGLIGTSEVGGVKTISIQNSYNVGKLVAKKGTGTTSYVGGLIGNISNSNLTLNNVYNCGDISNGNYNYEVGYFNSSSSTIKNAYYNKNKHDASNTSTNSFTHRDDIQQTSFTTLLNGNISSIDVNSFKNYLISVGLIDNNYDIHAKKWSFDNQLKYSILLNN